MPRQHDNCGPKKKDAVHTTDTYDLLACPKKLVAFSQSDGADLHCEPNGTGLRDLRVFNWLDETLG